MCNKYNYELIDNKIELLWSKPSGNNHYPCLLFIHGHNEERIGAKMHTNFLRNTKRLDRWGVVLASVSQIGYGDSKGAPDYCGPKTQDAIISALNFLKNQSFVNSDKMVVVGYSRGAIVASMLQLKFPNLAAMILGADFYDFQKYFDDSPDGIKEAILKETKVEKEECIERSILSHTKKLSTPTLIFHGAKDERKGVQGAKHLFDALNKKGIPSKLNIYEDYGHHIPFKVFFRESQKFIKGQLNIE